jgi:hypothetical protein
LANDINVKSTAKDKKSWFNTKKFKVGNLNVDRPLKTLDIKGLSQVAFHHAMSQHPFKLCEATKIIRNFDDINSLYDENDDTKIRDFFCQKTWLSGLPCFLGITFEFNPIPHMKNSATIAFLDHYYAFSNPFLAVPNIRTNRISTLPKYRKDMIIDLNGYIKAIDRFFEILNTKNHKPIFMPVSLRMSLKELDKLADHYLRREHYYYWFDFEGKAINESTLARLRHFFRRISNSGYYDKILVYFSNEKREIISNVRSELSPASDVLCPIAGANIVGCNREPRRIINQNAQATTHIPPEHKARILQTSSYYYKKIHDPSLFPRPKYAVRNAQLLDNEFQKQNEIFNKDQTIVDYLATKQMLNSYKDGSILREITQKFPETSGVPLSDFFA